MANIKTSELQGAALDYAVAVALGYRVYVDLKKYQQARTDFKSVPMYIGYCAYSTDWSQGGPIIERENINWYRNNKRGFPSDSNRWNAHITHNHDEEPIMRIQFQGWGETQLVAAMRCYVASKLGDVIDIPDELVVV